MYQHLPSEMKRNITPMLFGDQQMGAVVRDLYKDESKHPTNTMFLIQ
jgi:hypothetical protein